MTAFNRDGSTKWQKVDSQTTALNVGPTVGPDGKIYAVFGPGELNTVALNPDGTVAWTRNDNLSTGQNGPKEIVFGHSLSRLYFSQNTSAGQRLFAHDLNGNNVSLDNEVVSLTQTDLAYQLMIQAMNQKFGLLHTAIGA